MHQDLNGTCLYTQPKKRKMPSNKDVVRLIKLLLETQLTSKQQLTRT